MDDYSILDAELPTMVVRCNNKLVLRSIITGQHLQIIGPVPNSTEVTVPAEVHQKCQQIEQEYIKALEAVISLIPYENLSKISITKPVPVITERNKSPTNMAELPPCKVQRNYCCTLCSYYTQNPRSHLLHQRDVHGIRLSIHGCQHCQYASRYCQKLKRHIKMVHTLGNPQESMVKNEKPTEEAGKSTKVLITKPNEYSSTAQKTLPQISKPSMELPSCSKTVNVTQKSVDAKRDPEAFFVTAYKNQLQKQLEYEQHLKQFAKTLNPEPSVLQKPSAMPKQPKEPQLIANNQPYSKINNPFPIIEENREGKCEPNKKRMYSCRKCNYITHIKSRYNKHVKYHSMPMIQCDKCEFRTTYKWNLTRHLRSHHSNGIYKCSVCSFSANMKQSLTSHEVNHHSPPVGRAVGNKPIRKRRCRVGGSDLLTESSNPVVQKSSSASNFDCTNNPKKSQPYHMQEITENRKLILENIFHSNNSTSNENDSSKSEDNIHNPTSMDFSDVENSDLDTSGSGDIEADSSGDSSSSVPEKFNNAPIHIDADFLSNSLETVSTQPNRTMDPQICVNTICEQKFLQHNSEDYAATTSESNSSVSTISADETSDRNSNVSCNTSIQSSCDSEDDIELSSNMSTISEVSIKETTDKNHEEITPMDAI